MSAERSAATEREWVIYRSCTHTQVFVGIKADSRDAAIAAFYEGQGDLAPDRERWSKWDVDAVDVKP